MMEEFLYKQALPVALLMMAVIWLAMRYQKKDKQVEVLSTELVKLATLFQQTVEKKHDDYMEGRDKMVGMLQEIKDTLKDIANIRQS